MTANSQFAMLNAKEENMSLAIRKLNAMEVEYGK